MCNIFYEFAKLSNWHLLQLIEKVQSDSKYVKPSSRKRCVTIPLLYDDDIVEAGNEDPLLVNKESVQVDVSSTLLVMTHCL